MAEKPADAIATVLMASGGDPRIVLKPQTGLNRYFSAPRPSDVVAYASSTANDISPAAFDHVCAYLDQVAPGGTLSEDAYGRELERLRRRIRSAYALGEDVEIVFAASGTDLEYVALACAEGRAEGGTHNILLGADEVGSGCIHSALGQYFAEETALGTATAPGQPVLGFGPVTLAGVPVREPGGSARRSDDVRADMERALAEAGAAGRYPLIHVVHGSKTGLIVPGLTGLDRIRRGSIVAVDACQARITSEGIAEYLERGVIVFLTGSKFMGAPPFSGFALVPRPLMVEAQPLPSGFATIFRRAEWPSAWPGAERLSRSVNAGLLLRLQAAIFELESFRLIPSEEVRRIVSAFEAAVQCEMLERLGVSAVPPHPGGVATDAHPVEMRTLVTLDLSNLAGGARSFEDAQSWQSGLLAHGVRLGQPVKCVKLPDGRWSATLRIGLTMRQIVDRVGLDENWLKASFASDMTRIAEVLGLVASGRLTLPSGEGAASS